jgi:hypothetical protein
MEGVMRGKSFLATWIELNWRNVGSSETFFVALIFNFHALTLE